MKHLLRLLAAACCLPLLCSCSGLPFWESSDISRLESATPVDYGTPTFEGDFDTHMPKAVLKLVNDARRAAGVQPLKMDHGVLLEAAKTRAKEITVRFAHERPNGDLWSTVFSQFAIPCRQLGENLACGQPSAEIVYDNWWASQQGHRENMLNAAFTHVSIVCLKHNESYFWVQLFRGD